MTMTTTIQPPSNATTGSMPASAAQLQEMVGKAMGMPNNGGGAVATSRFYYDDRGNRIRAGMDVPVDQYGKLTSALFRCGKCDTNRWVPIGVAAKGDPMCQQHGRRMKRQPIRTAGLVPWPMLRAKVVPQLWPLWFGLAVATLGQTVHTRHTNPVILAGAAVPVGVLVWSVVRARLLKRAREAGTLADEDTGRRRRNQISRRAVAAGRWSSIAVLWLAAAAMFGADTQTRAGQVLLTILAALWVFPASTWWRWRRRLNAYRATKEEPEPAPSHMDVPMDPDEEQCRRVWSTIVAVRKDAIIGKDGPDRSVKAERAGRLVDTWLESWHRVEGGWAATIVGPDGQYTADKFEAARGAIASAFRMRTPMITVIPDGDDENRAMVLAQRTSPINEAVPWPGPSSVDGSNGTAFIARYADGTPVPYEIFRAGWGTPHVFTAGTTGAGKSALLSALFAIDRWASYIPEGDAETDRRGMVASFLIDPQQGQSFAPFLDDLAAPVASSLDEAKMLVEALLNEMYRRNRYLAREAKTWDERRGKWRTGRSWWNPLVDGPILSLTIDEAHLYLGNREFCAMVTAAGRMWRKCGGQLRIGTQTPLLGDLGGSMALRDMLTGGSVFVFRTANSLTGHTAFNGRLAADPRQIPQIPGTCYVLSGDQPKAMLGRVAWMPDWYDAVRDLADEPIGYPAELPAVTLAAFGPEYAAWAADPDSWLPGKRMGKAPAEVSSRSVEAVRLVLSIVDPVRNPEDAAALLGESTSPDGASVEQIDKVLRSRNVTYSVRTIRDALKRLRDTGDVVTTNGRHRLTGEAMAAVLETVADV